MTFHKAVIMVAAVLEINQFITAVAVALPILELIMAPGITLIL